MKSIALFGALALSLAPLINAAPEIKQHTTKAISFAELAVHPQRSASATAISLNNTTLSSQLLAVVERIDVRTSESVSQGQVLLQLNCEDYQLNLQQARAQREGAEAQLKLALLQQKRSIKLQSQSLESRDLVDTRNANVAAQRAILTQQRVNVERATLDVQHCTVIAPFNGEVSQRLATEGQLANVGTPLLTLVDTQRLELSAKVPVLTANQFNEVTEFFFEAQARWPVTLSNRGQVINSSSRNIDLRFTFTADRPPAGSAGKLVWADPRNFIPASALVKRGNLYGVFINEAGSARFQPLPRAVPGRDQPSDLPLSTLIITEGVGSLQHGDTL